MGSWPQPPHIITVAAQRSRVPSPATPRYDPSCHCPAGKQSFSPSTLASAAGRILAASQPSCPASYQPLAPALDCFPLFTGLPPNLFFPQLPCKNLTCPSRHSHCLSNPPHHLFCCRAKFEAASADFSPLFASQPQHWSCALQVLSSQPPPSTFISRYSFPSIITASSTVLGPSSSALHWCHPSNST